jgi:hypothetical protein
MENDIEELIDGLKNPAPSILYHYTSQQGLLAIINSKTIWATNIYYLNDSSEYEYAAKLIQDVIREYLITPPGSSPSLAAGIPLPTKITPEMLEQMLLESIRGVISLLTTRYRIYVCSFSEEGDQLSQWRGYCPNGNGFSLGFATSPLQDQMVKYSFGLVQCVYDKNEQTKIVKKIIDKSIIALKSSLGETDGVKISAMLTEIAASTVGKLFFALSRLKHETFREEKEWRFVALYNDSQPLPILFREGKYMITPYVEIQLADNQESNKIDRIIMGPTSHKLLAQKATKLLMDSNKIKCDVVPSKIPYRIL